MQQIRQRRGIILAGGTGSRLYPLTLAISKQLLPVFDKPMIYYPLSTLMLAGIREILLISTERDLPRFQQLMGNGNQWGIDLQYVVQPSPDGLAQALILAEDFLDGAPSALILGDNIFYGHDLATLLTTAETQVEGATIFLYHVGDPQRYGVAEIDADNRVVSLEEKPGVPKSNYAVTGLYFYDDKAPAKARELKPSGRGELEITDLNKSYMSDMQLHCEIIKRGYTWLDTGTPESLLEAQQLVQTIEHRQGLKISCPEEIAFHNGWIHSADLLSLAQIYTNSDYGQYLLRLAR